MQEMIWKCMKKIIVNLTEKTVSLITQISFSDV